MLVLQVVSWGFVSLRAALWGNLIATKRCWQKYGNELPAAPKRSSILDQHLGSRHQKRYHNLSQTHIPQDERLPERLRWIRTSTSTLQNWYHTCKRLHSEEIGRQNVLLRTSRVRFEDCCEENPKVGTTKYHSVLVLQVLFAHIFFSCWRGLKWSRHSCQFPFSGSVQFGTTLEVRWASHEWTRSSRPRGSAQVVLKHAEKCKEDKRSWFIGHFPWYRRVGGRSLAKQIRAQPTLLQILSQIPHDFLIVVNPSENNNKFLIYGPVDV